MEITWHGNSCFSIKTNNATVAVNPYNDKSGIKLPKLKAEIAVVTGEIADNNNVDAIQGEPYLIDWPGEYEVKEVAVTAIPAPEGNGFLFNLVADGLKICFIEKVGKELNDELIDKIGDVDILIVAVGGGDVMSAETAHKVAERIEPRSIIPMYYKVPGVQTELAELETFVKVAGISNAEPVDKAIISGRSALKEDQTEYFILKPHTA